MDAAVIAKVQAAGLDVYMRDPGDTYLYFTDGQNIGYLQDERFGGYSISTVHVPNRETGTGFGVKQGLEIDDLTAETLRDAMVTGMPSWSRGTAPPRKWGSMAKFLAANSWNGGFQKQEATDA